MTSTTTAAGLRTSPFGDAWRALFGKSDDDDFGGSFYRAPNRSCCGCRCDCRRAIRGLCHSPVLVPLQTLMVQINLLITALGGISYWIAHAASGGKHFAIPFGQSVFRWLNLPVIDILVCCACIAVVCLLQWRRIRGRRGAWSASLGIIGLSFVLQSALGFLLHVPNEEVPPPVLYSYFAVWGVYLIVQSRRWSASRMQPSSASMSPAKLPATPEERIELVMKARKRSTSLDHVIV